MTYRTHIALDNVELIKCNTIMYSLNKYELHNLDINHIVYNIHK